MLNEQIGKNIRAFRKNRGLNQQEFANTIFTSPARVSNWENGKWMPTAEDIIVIAEAFGVTMDEVVGREPWK